MTFSLSVSKNVLHYISKSTTIYSINGTELTNVTFFEIPYTRTNNYKYSYYPNSIYDWNSLSIDTIESCSLELFLEKL